MNSRPLQYRGNKAVRDAINNPSRKLLPLKSTVDILRNVDKYCMQLWKSECYQVNENKSNTQLNLG